jgi:hypothetical protein
LQFFRLPEQSVLLTVLHNGICNVPPNVGMLFQGICIGGVDIEFLQNSGTALQPGLY